MRKIQVLILRLFLDSGLPEELRGTLQAVPEGKPQAFAGEDAFLTVLRQFSRLADGNDSRLPVNIPPQTDPIKPEKSG